MFWDASFHYAIRFDLIIWIKLEIEFSFLFLLLTIEVDEFVNFGCPLTLLVNLIMNIGEMGICKFANGYLTALYSAK